MATTSSATCHTDGCANADIPLDLYLSWEDDDTGQTEYVSAVMCGVCGQEITDVVPPLPTAQPKERQT